MQRFIGGFSFTVVGVLMAALSMVEAPSADAQQLARPVDESGLQRMINHPDPNEHELDSFILRIHA